MRHKLCLRACAYLFEDVAAAVEQEGLEDVEVRAFAPACERPLSEEYLRELRSAGDFDGVILLGGGCMALDPETPDQCIKMLAPAALVDAHQRAGAFVISSGWLAGWKHYVTEHWGFDRETARAFFAESMAQIVLMDTGTRTDSAQKLEAFAAFVDRPYEIVPVGLEHLRLYIAGRVLAWRNEAQNDHYRGEMMNAQRRMANYAMTVDLLKQLSRATTEAGAIDTILDLFTALFAPKRLFYVPFNCDQDDRACMEASNTCAEDEVESVREQADAMTEPYQLTETGFLLIIGYQEKRQGALLVENIAFPEYTDHYLNLALAIVDVCGLAIDNARNYQHLVETEETLLEAQETLLKAQSRLKLLNRISTGIISDMTVEQVINYAVEQIADRFPDYRVVYSTVDGFGNLTVVRTLGPPHMPDVSGLQMDLSSAPTYISRLLSEQFITIEDIYDEPMMLPIRQPILSGGARAMLDVPLMHAVNLVGVLSLDADQPVIWEQHEIDTLREIGSYLSIAIRDARARQQKREAEAQLRYQANLLHNVSDAIIAVDRAFTIRSWNRAARAMYGWREDEVTGRPIDDVLGMGEHFCAEEIWKLLKSGGMWSGEVTHYRRDGSPIDVHSSISLITRSGEENGGFVTVNRDITERKRIEQDRLRLAVEQERIKLMQDFIGTASQEFRTPLSTINANLYLLERSSDPQAASDQIQTLRQQTAYIGSLSEAIISMARLSGRPDLDFSPLDINRELTELGTRFDSSLREKNLRFTLQLEDCLPPVWGDKWELHNALAHVIQNAIQYTPEDGTISVETHCHDEWAVIEIADTGIGISQADLDHIFEPFYRADQALSKRRAGLGLATAHRIIELHGGSLEVESEEGKGSIFRVILPTQHEPERA